MFIDGLSCKSVLGGWVTWCFSLCCPLPWCTSHCCERLCRVLDRLHPQNKDLQKGCSSDLAFYSGKPLLTATGVLFLLCKELGTRGIINIGICRKQTLDDLRATKTRVWRSIYIYVGVEMCVCNIAFHVYVPSQYPSNK